MQIRHLLPALAMAAAACVALIAASGSTAAQAPATAKPTEQAHEVPPATQKLLREVRRATRVYRNVAAAEAAGYVRTGECAQDPKYGGMGYHYAHPRLENDGVLDPLRPEVLVYQPRANGTLRLGAVEYFEPDVDQDLATDSDRPSLFGVPFDGPMLGHDSEMPIHYDLHVWLYRENPAGIFAAWNPNVHCP
jgi:hypothetical protein